jgi:hypothetical protein
MITEDDLVEIDPELLPCPECGMTTNNQGRPWTARGLAYHRRLVHSVASTRTPAGTAPADTGEQPRQGWFARTFAKKPKSPAPHPKKLKAPAKGGRVSLAPVGSLAWLGGSTLAARAGDAPVAAVMQIQSGIAGEVLDNALKGTLVDKVIQPMIGGADKYRDFAMLAAFPLLAAIHERRPTAASWAALRLVAQENLVALSKGLKAAKRQAEQMAEVVADLDAEGLGLDPSDPAGSVLMMVGLQPPGQQVPAGGD